MGVPVPFSTTYALLLLALPAVWLAGRAAAHAVTRDRGARTPLGFGLALSFWVLAVHIASRATSSLRTGLPIGTLTLAAAGVVAEIVRRRSAIDRASGAPASPWRTVTTTFATLAFAPLALGYHLHDEILITGHMSIAAELQNGIYPPRHLTFPDVPLRYHYGFDLVTASITALFHVSVDQAIDIATIALFALSWALLWALGARLFGHAAAWIAPLCALLGGGLPVSCINNQPSLPGRVIDMCQIGKHYVNPPIPVYFLQHPWSLGIPIGVTAILVFTSRSTPADPTARPPSEPARLAVLAIVLAALSLSQVVLFFAFLPSFVVADAWHDGLDRRRGLRMLAVAVVSAVAAKLLGGFFVTVPDLPGLPFVLQAGFGATPSDTLLWNAQTFGVMLPLAALGFFALRRDRVLFALLALGSLAVVNSIRYEATEDIMKFATLGTLAFAILGGAAIARWAPKNARAVLRAPVRTTLAISLVGLACLSGAVFVAFMDARWSKIPGWMRTTPAAASPSDAEAIAWIRARIRPGEIVYRNAKHTYEYALWGGLPQPWIQWTARAFGFPEARISAREKLNRGAPAPVATYRAQGYRFFVLDSTREDKALRAAAKEWIAAGEARVATRIGALLVVELKPE